MRQTNPQSGCSSASGSSSSGDALDAPKTRFTMRSASFHLRSGSGGSSGSKDKQHISLPALFWLIEMSEWEQAANRATRHPREVKTWATIRTRSSSLTATSGGGGAFDRGDSTASQSSTGSVSTVDSQGSNISSGSGAAVGTNKTVSCSKRLALHHACFKLRHVHSRSRRVACTDLSTDSFCADRNSIKTNPASATYRLNGNSPNPNTTSCAISVDGDENDPGDDSDPWITACQTILTLIKIYPEAAGMRESRHGCLPLHLAAFAACPMPPSSSEKIDACILASSSILSTKKGASGVTLPPPPPSSPPLIRRSRSTSKLENVKTLSGDRAPPSPRSTSSGSSIPRPNMVSKRSTSQSSCETGSSPGGISAMISEEIFTGNQNMQKIEDLEKMMLAREEELRRHQHQMQAQVQQQTASSSSPKRTASFPFQQTHSAQSKQASTTGHAVMRTRSGGKHSHKHRSHLEPDYDEVKRDEATVQVINALLDAYSKGVRVDSEGGRLPLHTACAGKASAAVITTLLTAYPAAARHRNKDGFLPLHLAAHWGVSSPEVAHTLLRAYPEAAWGRNRWERTPLEEALCMAGENGRPHQGALVRALRRHPSYWSRLPTDMDNLLKLPGGAATPTADRSAVGNNAHSASPKSGHRRIVTTAGRVEGKSPNIVDVDETVADSDSSSSDGLRNIVRGGSGVPLLSGDLIDAAENGSRPGQQQQTHHRLMGRLSLTPRNILRKSPTNGAVAAAGSSSINPDKHKRSVSHPPSGTNTVAIALAESTELASLIRSMQWPAVIARAELHPAETTQTITAHTRGGFISQLSPLHYACERNPPVEVIETLIEANPKAASQKMVPGGEYPLHAACTWGASAGVVGFLLAANPLGAKALDELANLPLHSACFSGAAAEVVESLLCTYPKAVLARNCQGSSPTDIVRRLRHENRKEVLDLLESHKCAVMAKRGGSSGDHGPMAKSAMELNRRGLPNEMDSPKRKTHKKLPMTLIKDDKRRGKKIASPAVATLEDVEVSFDDADSTDGMIWV